MARNILLTSLSVAESNLPVRYFSIRNKSGFDYCVRGCPPKEEDIYLQLKELAITIKEDH